MKWLMCISLFMQVAWSQGDGAWVRLERSLSKSSFFVGERVSVTTRVLVRSQLLKEGSLRQLFGRRVDVPVDLRLKTISVDGGWEFERIASAENVTMVVNGQAIPVRRRALQVRDGIRFEVFEVQASRRVKESGLLRLSAVDLSAQRIVNYRDDFFEGRVADQVQALQATATQLNVTVKRLPAAGRLEAFRGAMGVESVSLHEVKGESDGDGVLSVIVRVTLTANGGLFGGGPVASDFPGFTIIEESFDTTGLVRAYTFRLRRVDGERTSLDPVTVCAFDPEGDGRYELLPTDRIELLARGSMGSPGQPRVEGLMQLDSLTTKPGRRVPGAGMVVLLLLPWLSWGLVILLRSLFQRVSSIRIASNWQRRRVELVQALEEGGDEALNQYRNYLALILGCRLPMVTSDRLFERLEALNVSPAVAKRCQQLLEELQSGEFGDEQREGSFESGKVVRALDEQVGERSSLPWVRALAAVFLMVTVGWSQGAWESEASSAFRSADYERTASIIDAALPDLDEGGKGVAFFNLGRCAEERGETAVARLYFQRALLRLPREGRVLEALNRLEIDTGVSQTSARGPFAWGWIWLSVLLESVCVFVALTGLRYGSRRRVVVAVLLGALVAGLCVNEAAEWARAQGVVVESGTALRSAPSMQAASLQVLPIGQSVDVLEESDRWVRVIWDNDEAWVRRESLDLGR